MTIKVTVNTSEIEKDLSKGKLVYTIDCEKTARYFRIKTNLLHDIIHDTITLEYTIDSVYISIDRYDINNHKFFEIECPHCTDKIGIVFLSDKFEKIQNDLNKESSIWGKYLAFPISKIDESYEIPNSSYSALRSPVNTASAPITKYTTHTVYKQLKPDKKWKLWGIKRYFIGEGISIDPGYYKIQKDTLKNEIELVNWFKSFDDELLFKTFISSLNENRNGNIFQVLKFIKENPEITVKDFEKQVMYDDPDVGQSGLLFLHNSGFISISGISKIRSFLRFLPQNGKIKIEDNGVNFLNLVGYDQIQEIKEKFFYPHPFIQTPRKAHPHERYTRKCKRCGNEWDVDQLNESKLKVSAYSNDNRAAEKQLIEMRCCAKCGCWGYTEKSKSKD